MIMKTERLWLTSIIVSLTISVIIIPSSVISKVDDSGQSMEVVLQGKNLFVEARDVSLGKLLEEIASKCNIEIQGMEGRQQEIVTFFSRGNQVEIVIKRLLRGLAEKNYAFEFDDERLKTVRVMPKSQGGDVVPPAPPKKEKPTPPAVSQKTKASAVQVQGIVEGSQAENLDILEGDQIVSYDGVPIKSVQQLVQEVKKHKPEENVEMVISRDGVTIPIILNGGFIGVRIKMAQVDSEDQSGY